MKSAAVGVVAAAVSAASHAAWACPVCDSPTGAAVRAGIFNDQFVVTLLLLLVPFPILAVVAAGIHFGWKPVRVARSRDGRDGA